MTDPQKYVDIITGEYTSDRKKSNQVWLVEKDFESGRREEFCKWLKDLEERGDLQMGEVEIIESDGEVEIIESDGEVEIIESDGEVEIIESDGEVEIIESDGEVEIIETDV
jgi:hypothetical protein